MVICNRIQSDCCQEKAKAVLYYFLKTKRNLNLGAQAIEQTVYYLRQILRRGRFVRTQNHARLHVLK